jgi:glycine cleavage system regulatory protein
MARTLVLTVIGPDRPGLVEGLAERIAAHGGSWDESRMARLAGHFAGVVQIHLPAERAEGLIAALPELASRGLSVGVVNSEVPDRPVEAGGDAPARDRGPGSTGHRARTCRTRSRPSR